MTLALAREVGLLRMRVGPASALEIPHEGPEVGSRTEIAASIEGLERKELGPRRLHLRGLPRLRGDAPGGRLDRRASGRGGRLASTRSRESEAWAALDVPGSPYAVALDSQGTVLAKGTFNNLAQLESILAAGERRRGGLAEAAPCLSARIATGSARRSRASPATPRAAGSSPGSAGR